MPRMYLDVFSDNSFETNCWLIGAGDVDEAIVVDPGFSPVLVHRMLETSGRRPVAVLATHGHFDHIGSAAEFCGDELPFYIHEDDVLALTDPPSWGAGFDTPPVPVKDVRTVTEGDELAFAGFRIEVVHMPGHTPGSVCYRTDGWVMSGDLVFAGTIGRSDFPNSSPPKMQQSLRRFLELPDEADVYPGHGPRTTVGRERERNPFLEGLGGSRSEPEGASGSPPGDPEL
jgi:hydroxyacylglutathione hydrolase